MSYQVLARKWRPQNFTEMVGQEHVLRALVNALDNDRLHHAYLFTGTRGVGKTTIARILAKCLNCEIGVTSKPCGECSSCKEIVTGNFVDLIEVDAASRTKVEDTRELLDNVQYAPTRGRFKVYLIDEVHMLTGHSFNALLKTLEEPPPHVKFLFATTDPQKLPVTILSRCLQFNLKRMPVDMISGHLNYLLEQENIPFEEPSLKLISRAADGSMRDALSLLDQSIAFSGENLKEVDVREMLGTISHEPLLALLESINNQDGSSLLQQVEDLSGVTPDFEAATDALISLLHQLAILQVVPDAHEDDESLKAVADKLSKEDVQLYYQIALNGRRDLPLSPDPRSGFEMLLLRMMSFSPLREGMKVDQTSHSSTNEVTQSKKKTSELDSLEQVNKREQDNSLEQENSLEQIKKTEQLHSTVPVRSTEPAYNPEPIANPAQSSNSEQRTSPQQIQNSRSLDEQPQAPKVQIPQLAPQKTTKPPQNDEVPPPWEIDAAEAQPFQERLISQVNSSNQASTRREQSKTNKQISNNNNVVEKEVPLAQNDQKEGRCTSTSTKWHDIAPQLALSGRAAELIKHCLLDSNENGIISLRLEKSNQGLLADSIESEVELALATFYGIPIKLSMSLFDDNETGETPAQRNTRLNNELQKQAEHNIETDPFVIELQNRFGAQIVPGSVIPK